MTTTDIDIAFLLENSDLPKMLVKPCAVGFMMVPFDILKNLHLNHNYSSWHYAFVNKENGMYKFLFTSFDELADALFSAKEICYGTYPLDAKPNPLYGKSIEWIKMQHDLTDS